MTSSIGQELSRKDRTQTKPVKKRSRVKTFGIVLLMIGLTLGLTSLSIRVYCFRSVNGIAEWRSTGGQKYLYVWADSDFELGYLAGQGLSKEIYALKQILFLASPKYGLSYNFLAEISQEYETYIPEYLMEEMRGMAFGASYQLGLPITYEDILIQNCWLDIIYGRVFPTQLGPLACTAIGFQNTNGSITLGQNFDFTASFLSTLSFVLHQKGDDEKIFSLRFGAGLDLPIGKNAHITSLATVIRSTMMANYMIPITCRTRLAFEQAQSYEDFYSVFFETLQVNHSLSFNLIFADERSMLGVEVLPNQTYALENFSIIKSNTYTHPDWQEWLFDQTYSKDRQLRAELLLQDRLADGILSENELQQILEDSPTIHKIAQNGTDVGTLAFFSSHQFGIGNFEAELGHVPI